MAWLRPKEEPPKPPERPSTTDPTELRRRFVEGLSYDPNLRGPTYSLGADGESLEVSTAGCETIPSELGQAGKTHEMQGLGFRRIVCHSPMKAGKPDMITNIPPKK